MYQLDLIVHPERDREREEGREGREERERENTINNEPFQLLANCYTTQNVSIINMGNIQSFQNYNNTAT